MKENGPGKKKSWIDKIPARVLKLFEVICIIISVSCLCGLIKIFLWDAPSFIKESGYDDRVIFAYMAEMWVILWLFGIALWKIIDSFCNAMQICQGFLEQLLLIVIPADLMGMCGRLYFGWMGKFCKREIVYADHIDQNTYAVYVFLSIFLTLLAYYLIVLVLYLIVKKRRA